MTARAFFPGDSPTVGAGPGLNQPADAGVSQKPWYESQQRHGVRSRSAGSPNERRTRSMWLNSASAPTAPSAYLVQSTQIDMVSHIRLHNAQ
jgi:hypothetical protein